MQAEITTSKAVACRLLGIQLAITLFAAGLWYLISGIIAAYSALLGGLACILPNAWFITNAFRADGQTAPQLILSRLYIGEAGKLVLTGILFALVFWLVNEIHIGALFLTFVIMIIVNLAGLAQLGLNNGFNKRLLGKREQK
jgi:ATP synthase protein I